MNINITKEQALLLIEPINVIIEKSKNDMIDALTTNDVDSIKAISDNVTGWICLKNSLEGKKEIAEVIVPECVENAPKVSYPVKKAEVKKKPTAKHYKNFEYGGTPVPNRDGEMVMFGSYKCKMKAVKNLKKNIDVHIQLDNGKETIFAYKDDSKFDVCKRIGIYIVRGGVNGRNSKSDVKNYEVFEHSLIMDVMALVEAVR